MCEFGVGIFRLIFGMGTIYSRWTTAIFKFADSSLILMKFKKKIACIFVFLFFVVLQLIGNMIKGVGRINTVIRREKEFLQLVITVLIRLSIN